MGSTGIHVPVTVIFINTVIVGNFNGFKILKIYQNKSVNHINFFNFFLQTMKFNSHRNFDPLPLSLPFSIGIPPYAPEYDSAPVLSISELVASRDQYKDRIVSFQCKILWVTFEKFYVIALENFCS